LVTKETNNKGNIMENLDDIKVGDKVIMSIRNARSVKVVRRVTNTMIVVHNINATLDGKPIERRFRKCDGGGINCDTFYYSSIKHWTQDEEDEIRHNIIKQKLVEKIKNFPFASLNVSDLEKIENVINDYLVDINVQSTKPKVSEEVKNLEGDLHVKITDV
jgi:hypothetical protein